MEVRRTLALHLAHLAHQVGQRLLHGRHVLLDRCVGQRGQRQHAGHAGHAVGGLEGDGVYGDGVFPLHRKGSLSDRRLQPVGWPWRRTELPKAAADPRLALVVSETIRAVDGQQGNLDNLRARVGIVLSAATIATSFLGGIALEGDRSLTIPGYAAVVLFIVHIGSGLHILWPRDWTFQTSAQYMVANWIEQRGYGEDEMRRRLVYWSEHHLDTNARLLNRLWNWYAVAIVLLGAEIVAWIMDLGGFQGWILGLLC